METKNTLTLTERDTQLLALIPKFPKLDRGSQERIRKQIDARRKESPDFENAFNDALAGHGVAPHRREEVSFLRMIAEVVTHPIEATKAMVGETLLKRRNKAPEILQYPHPTLSKVAEPWDFATDNKEELIEIVRQLGAALRGVNYGDRLGMAAPQIGISKRVFVCQGAVCVNPTFTPPVVGQKVEMLEGCYSIPDNAIYKTQRHTHGWAKWTSVRGIERAYKLKGNDAVVFQHELDHLDGKCACNIGVLYTPEEYAKTAH